MVTEAQKKANKKYRKLNKDKINQLQLGLAKKYYQSHRDEVLEYKKKYYCWKKISQEFRNILFEDIGDTPQ